MDDLIRFGMEARKDWAAYYSASREADLRYHNRPDCEDGSQIEDENIRAGTAGRPLCDKCRSAERPAR